MPIDELASFLPFKEELPLQTLFRKAAASEALLPLSVAQQRLWFLAQHGPGDLAFHTPMAMRLVGRLNTRALEQSLNEIVRAHQVLHTIFAAIDGYPVQVIAPPVQISLGQVDLSDCFATERESQTRYWAREQARRPFDLAQGPLVRAILFQWSKVEHILFLTMHRIVADDGAYNVLLNELAAFYEIFSSHRGGSELTQETRGPRKPVLQYSDYCLWQQEWLQSKAMEEHLAYWKRQLRGMPAVLELSTDRPRPPIQTYGGARQVFVLPVPLAEALKTSSPVDPMGLFLTFLSAFQVLLHRYTGQNDIMVGLPVSGGSWSDLHLIGPLTNLLVLRTDLSGNPTARELLDRVRETVSEAYAHQALPFEKLVQELEPTHDLSHPPLCQVRFNFEREAPEVQSAGLTLNEWMVDSGVTEFDVSLTVREGAQGFVGIFEYNTDLFKEATILRMLGHFQTLLEGIVADPDRRLSNLPLVTAAERYQLLIEWNHCAAPPWQVSAGDAMGDHPCDQCIHDLFEAQVARTPDAVAVVWNPSGSRQPDQHLTYRELNRRADQLAHYLLACGVRPEVLVGLCVERSVELLIGLLGILKAGGVYVPLDPLHPPQRLAFTLADAHLSVVLTQARLLACLLVPSPTVVMSTPHIVCLDAEWDTIAQQDERRPASSVSPDNLAYVIYTSGSTGQPKGVPITHQNVLPILKWSLAYLGLGPHSQVLQNLNPCFDFGVLELLTTLLGGGVLHLLGESARAELDQYADYIRAHGINTLHTTPSFLRQILREGDLLPTLEVLHLGGEALTRDLLDEVFQVVGERCVVYNGYGPTETSINCSIYRVCPPAQGHSDADISVPIGRASAQNVLYVLDQHGQLVPSGVPGELHVGGPALARGYLNRPELTAERFLPDPFTLSSSPTSQMGENQSPDESLQLSAAALDWSPGQAGAVGGRLYKTGDLVRYRSDGNIEFMGRRDHQVKLRGYRIELGEIEAVLMQHAGIREALVLVHDAAQGAERTSKDQGAKIGGIEPFGRGPRLVAYVVPAKEPAPGIRELGNFLKAKLPEYMVPSMFVTLEALPRTPTGKLDRRALPDPEPRLELESFALPRTLVEDVIASIWSQVLGVERVSINADFLELGGHSLLATLVISRIREAFQAKVTINDLFEAPTVAGLAQRIELALQENQVGQIPLIPCVPREGGLPLSFAQQRLWLMDQLAPHSPLYNIPAVFHIAGELDAGVLERCLDEIVRRHEALRTLFVEVSDQPVQLISPPYSVRLPIVDLRSLPRADRSLQARQWMEEQARQPFDLHRGPLLRALLVQLGDREQQLLLNLHHIVFDGWSVGVLIEELKALYEAFARGETSPLPELPIQYADYAQWQHQYLQGDTLDNLLAYWKAQFSGNIPVLDLPTDLPRPATQTYRGTRRSRALPPALIKSVEMFSHQAKSSPFMVMLAAFQTLLFRYTGQTDLVVGMPIANRNRPDIEGLIGFFVNTLPIRGNLSGDPTFRELVERVRQATLGAHAHQDLPLERIVEALNPERHSSYNALFQVVFVVQNMPMEENRLSDARIHLAEEMNTGTAKFDLTLSIEFPAEGTVAIAEYNTDLFKEATILRMLGHFQTLLEDAVARPDQRLSDLALLTQTELDQLLIEWNDTVSDYPRDRYASAIGEQHLRRTADAMSQPMCIHKLFEVQVELTPDVVALVSEEEHLTYRELNRQTNRLAHYLCKLGIGPEVLVGVYLERSLQVIISVLGVLKAGGAYVPFDPTYPSERIAFMLEDTGAPVLLTQQRRPEHLDGQAWHKQSCKIVYLDSEWPIIARECGENPTPEAETDNMAYVLYTSGSTGRPKGVCCQHGGVVNLLEDFARRQPLAVGEQCSWWTSLNFDVSVYEIFSPLFEGGTLQIMPEAVRADSLKLIEWMNIHKIGSAYIPPFMLADVERSLRQGTETLPLRRMLVGVEPIPERLLAVIQAGLTSLHIINGYGPTEATICCTLYSIDPISAGNRNTPIGKPAQNTHIYLLDPHLNPVPVGVPGELYIEGIGLARGYLKRPELTAAQFIPNPFSHLSLSPFAENRGVRLYRTGDVARYLPDGNIEFIGRRDQQVKVRGFRIEPGEIEAILGQHPDVGQVIVVAREDERSTGNKQLIAYIVPTVDQGEALDSSLWAAELRRFLKNKLPEYLLPSAFVFLAALPLTPSGKVDRRALPTPDLTQLDSKTVVAPRTPVEEMLAGIWAQVLGLEQVGIHDNFFELGGHSLLATQIVSRVRQAFQVELLLRNLFEAPTIAGLARSIEAAVRVEQEPVTPPLAPVARTGDLPLSFAQQRLWFLDQLEPDSPFYNISIAMRLSGELNLAALEQSLNEIVRRHEALRTTFAAVGGRPIQVIAPARAAALPVVDLGGVEAAQREAQAQRMAAEEARRPFDLARGPLTRAVLLRLEKQEHALLVTMHHIVSDGWSVGIWEQELGVLYRAFLTGEPSPLADLAVQYADFAAWQRQWLSPQGKALAAQLDYWKRHLSGAPAVLELATDRPHPAVQTFRGATQSFELSPTLSESLKALSRREGVTLFMALLAAFEALLHRYTGQSDLVVGTAIANRNHAEVEKLIGFFVNTLALRADLSGDPVFRTLLSRVRETTLGAYAHQDVPFEMLVDELQPERDLSRTPLFQVMFMLQNAPTSDLELPSLTLHSWETESGTAKFDLTLFMIETEDELQGTWEYNTDLFDAVTIERMSGHFQILLESVIANPKQRLSDLTLLTDIERQQLLGEWNDTQVDYPKDQYIHELFEMQVEQSPDVVAVVFDPQDGARRDQHLTYQALNRRANQLAHHLRRQGVAPEILVGICVERSLEMVVGLLGILKAGGAYLPLDPTYPQERLAFMLADANAPVLLTAMHLSAHWPSHTAKITCLDSDWQTIAQERDQNLIHQVIGTNVAYLIYTSGSTGWPKGVVITHQSAVALVHWAGSVFSREDLAGMLAATSICFDLSVFELFTPLSMGGTVILAMNALQLPQLSAAAQVRLVNTVPSVMAELARSGELPPSVRTVNLAGEALPLALVQQLYAHETIQNVYNLYGPTEGTTYSTWALAPKRAADAPSIGRPVANTRVYVLDHHLQPVPMGVAGELYIGGDGLARDYLNRPDLTAERFLPDPFSFQAGQRLYRTGDWVRYLPDGNIEFLGRRDSQVKIRGFRIELGEIEAMLSQHPDVGQVVVAAREDRRSAGNKQLIAYIVPTVDQREALDSSLWAAELRRFLKNKLPEYLLPSAFVFLAALPLTPSGKVDRRALPTPDLTQLDSKTVVAPRTPVEEMLAGIWAQVLGLEQVGIHDNFFELGGHSLLATQIVSRVRQVFQIELPLRNLFQEPTVAGLARSIEAAVQVGQELAMPPLAPVARTGDLPLSFAQQRLWFLDQLEPDSPFYNIPTAIRLSGELNLAALKQSLNEIVRRHETLRTTFATVEGRPVQIIAPARKAALPVVDLEELEATQREAQAQCLATEEAQRPFDLARGLLARAVLLRLGEQEHVLLVTMHHIVSDGWSVGIWEQELGALYRAFSVGEPSPLADLAVQYADFACWQRQWLSSQGEALLTQLDYWKQRLNGAPALLELPADRPRPATQTYRGSRLPFRIPESTNKRLGKISQQEGATLFMTLLAAFKTLLWRYTRQTGIVVGIPIANRNRVEIEPLIGFFVNTLVLHTDFRGNPTFRELLAQVRQVALGAYAHQDLPFEKLVEELQPERSLSYSPLFQVMFALQNMPMETFELPGLSIDELEQEINITKFDLTLMLWNTRQGLDGALEYSTDLFDADTISRLAGHLETLLDGIATDPDRRLSDLPLLTANEQHRMLVEWNVTQADYPHKQCIYELFEEQVQQTPDAIAVVAENHHLSYEEMNRRTNQLARHLQTLGVGPEVRAGICVERCVEALVGIFGILKAGGAYVPLDPSYPQERLTFMLQDARMPVLLTQDRIKAKLAGHGAQVICLDTDWADLAGAAQNNPSRATSPDHLAYVIYTSGSTGQPKGVLVSHRNLCHSISAHLSYYDEPITGYLLLSPFAFDSSVTGIFWTLCQGGALVLPPEGFQQDFACLVTLLAERRPSHLVCVPTLYDLILSDATPEELAGLRCIVVAGDTCSKALVKRHDEMLPAASLFNEYGPTEATIWSSVYLCAADDGRMQVPIGRPIPNTQLYVLDGYVFPAPIGVAGELYIGGKGVTWGYLHRPELTAASFIPDAFAPQPGQRLYKTGDLARYLPDGNLEFVGRVDHQVKVRGFRVELGEIEATLREHESVREAVVVIAPPSREATSERQIVAYLVPAEGKEIQTSELRRFLLDRLPLYMAPSAFVSLAALPLTPHGKVDHGSLPAPEMSQTDARDYEAPRTPVEERLARIWSEVLRVERVGVHDNFFELGGDSIISIQVCARARRAGLRLTPKQIFERQTIAELAPAAQRVWNIEPTQALVTGPVPLTPIQCWFFERNLPDPHHFNQSILLQVKQPLEVSWLQEALQRLVLHHDGLRLRFEHTLEGWQQVNAGADKAASLICIDVSELPEKEQRIALERVMAELQASLNLQAGPLMRVAYLTPDRLLIIIHHLIVDDVSWRILIEDLETVYGQLERGETVQLPLKTASFKQWAEELRACARSDVVRQEMCVWLNQPWQRVTRLPVDDLEGANLVASAQAMTVSLDIAETHALLQVPQAYHAEINDVLLTALALALAQWTGNEVVLVDLEEHRREGVLEKVDLSRTVGWFTTIFPVLLDVSPVEKVGQALKSVKEQLRRVPNHRVNYGVMRYLGQDQETAPLRALPQAEIIFNYLGQTDSLFSGNARWAPAGKSSGPYHSLREKRAYVLRIDGGIEDGRLQFTWTYSASLYRRSVIEKVAQDFVRALRDIITHCQSDDMDASSPSDFPAARLNQKELEEFMARVGLVNKGVSG